MAHGRLTYRTATPQDVDDLAPRLRASDVREIAAITAMPPILALAVSRSTSTEAYVASIDGRVEVMFGARADLFGRSALIWALGTDALSEKPRRTITEARAWVDRWGLRYGLLTNTVHEENHASVNMLRHLGFTFGPSRDGLVSFWRKT